MQTQLQFTSEAFPPYPGEDENINPGIWGKRLAEFIVTEFRTRQIACGEIFSEDWGWSIPAENAAFPIFIGCSNQLVPDGNEFLCFIEPSKPEIRKGLFKKVSTVADVTRIAAALEEILRAHPGVSDLHWADELATSTD